MSKEPIARKSLGQHWLQDPESLEAICDAAELQPDDTVLEIGPGLGSLTRLLVERAGQVIAVELDEKLASELPARVKAENLKIMSQDILDFDFAGLPAGYKVAANIPYYLTGKLLRRLSETPNPPVLAVLLLQKEVAERVAATSPRMSIISVTAQFYWQVDPGRIVPATLFAPRPKVDSQILTLRRRLKPLFVDVDPKEFFRLVKAGFAQPRKTLLNNLGAGLRCSRDEAQSICDRASIDSRRRPQTLDLKDWYSLYRSLHT
jgi:16S rRNA (adenine1518-N6/adenine1519-N6)-dimethyltransferase